MASAKKSLADFKSAHDKSFIVPTKIKAALAALGPDAWEYEVDFIRIAGISSQDVAKYRSQFEDHLVTVKNKAREDRRVWAGSKALAAKMREMVQ